MHASDKPVKVGELQIWEIANTSLMDHPFHLHGFFFQVLQVNGEAPEFISWKDTVNLPPRSKVKIAWIPDNRPGSWMYHCHILEHHEAGMMGCVPRRRQCSAAAYAGSWQTNRCDHRPRSTDSPAEVPATGDRDQRAEAALAGCSTAERRHESLDSS